MAGCTIMGMSGVVAGPSRGVAGMGVTRRARGAVSVGGSAGGRSRRGAGARGARVIATAKAAEVTESTFESEILKSELPVLVDFWATWCGPCKLVSKSIDGLAADYAGKVKVVKVNADEAPNAVSKYGVYGLPTFMVFENGVKVEESHIEGAVPKAKIEELVGKYK